MATMTRADLGKTIGEELGLPRRKAERLVSSLIEVISERLSSGEKVRVSSFGSFMLRDKRERMGRNPRTGEPAAVSPRRVIAFRPSRILKSRIQEGLAGIGTDA